jgi:SpoIVB peptidase S55
MMPTIRSHLLHPSLAVVAGAFTVGVLFCMSPGRTPEPVRPAGGPGAKAQTYWEVDDVRPGMKGYGRTVMKGTKVETFQAEVIGILKNTSPGRDLILCRLAGLDLERTGIIAGMSGSPVYIDGKLLGAVAYGWAYGKDPIAGITPFAQMQGFAESYERRDLAEKGKARRVGSRHTLPTPVAAGARSFDSVTVAQSADGQGVDTNELWMTPLRTPLVATGFSSESLSLLRKQAAGFGLVPVQGGGAGARVAQATANVPLEPGGPLAITLIRGDFDLSGIGTVTHIEGNRVYGWGHPFMGLGDCEFPLMTGYIHTIFPRQTVSFKMGSPLRTVGVINADISTCIAGWLGRTPDLLPLKMKVVRSANSTARTFNVEVARHRSLMSSLVFAALSNSVDMEGEMPEEMTADLHARIELEGRPPVIIKDTFSGFSGGRAPQALYSQVASAVNLLTNNPYKPVRIRCIDCDTTIHAGRRTADIDAVELESAVYSPGDTLRARVYLRPYKGRVQTVRVSLALPADLPEGRYQATISDDSTAVRQDIRDNPVLNNPQDLEQVIESMHKQLSAGRTNLVVRVPQGPSGVALAGKELPDLPGSMVRILGHSRRTGAQTISRAIASRQPTGWIIQGQESVSFRVVKDKKLTVE